MHDEAVELGKRIGIYEGVDTLSGGAFAARVLPDDCVLTCRRFG
jgi:hypothetical protein